MAHHEAGHAVMAWFTGLRLRAATVTPGDGYLGMVEHSTGGLGAAAEEARFIRSTWRHDRNCMVAMAGAVAEQAAIGGLDPKGLAGDRRFVIELAHNLFPNQETSRAWVEFLWHRAIGILVSPGWWPAVESLAAELVARRNLRTDEARAAIGRGKLPDDKKLRSIRRLHAKVQGVECPFL